MKTLPSNQPLISITIPTWNRAAYLRLNLDQFATQLQENSQAIEILISDNCSTDETQAVVAEFQQKGLPIRSIRNTENIGSDCNIAQCFNEAVGRYVMILGDDDLLIDGALSLLVALLEENRYGVVSLGAYGYENDFRLEHPGGAFRLCEFADVSDFVVELGIFSTLISANIISKEILAGVDARKFCGSNLVQTQLVYRAALRAGFNACVKQHLVACKRNNSGGYAFSQVFVDRFGDILDECQTLGLSREAVLKLEQRLLIGYYPFYIWRQRLGSGEDLADARKRFQSRFDGRWAFNLFVDPIFHLPRSLALVWGTMAIAVGRVLTGDTRLGLNFAWNRLNRFLRCS
jgi:glycosyltransferase involved in cell wall biosynthesis